MADSQSTAGAPGADGRLCDPDSPADITKLVHEHAAMLYRYAYRLSGCAADAEDLTQQTFMAAQQHWDQLRDPQKSRGWLCAILRNCYLKLRKTRTPAAASVLDIDLNMAPAEAPDELEIDQEHLQSVLDELPADYKLVLMLYYFEEKSYREIAECLQTPIGTVMSRLSRAKSLLRSRLVEPSSAVSAAGGAMTAAGAAATRQGTTSPFSKKG